MDEFMKLNWRIKNHTELENQECCFISEEVISDSYIYKNFSTPLKKSKAKKIKLGSINSHHVPGENVYLKVKKKSSLTKTEKEHCFNALKLIQSGKSQSVTKSSEKYALEVYSKCQSKLVEENRQFLEYIEGLWKRKSDTYTPKIPRGFLNYSRYYWKRKCKNLISKYPQLYSEECLIGLNYEESESTVQYECVCNALEVGTLARFSRPKLKEKCTMRISTLPDQNKNTLSSKQPVSEDKNVLNLLENHKFDVVISSSGLKRILDNTDLNAKWLLPVIVKEVQSKGAKSRKVVFVDKVLPKTAPQYIDFKMYSCKRMLRTNFCRFDAFSYPVDDIELVSENPQNENPEENDKDEDNEEPVTKKAKKIMSKYEGVTHHNVSYRIWNLKKIGQDNPMMKNKVKNVEMNILVRTKLDGCEITDQGVLQPVIVTPKIEPQLQYGATIPSRSELAKEWTSLFFRPYSNLYRARLITRQSEVISVEKCSLQKINTEAHTHYDYKPHLGLGIIQKVLERLVELEPGNYLLQHLPKHGPFVALLKETSESGGNVFDLHSEYADCKVDFKTGENWLPVDVNYVLPVHESLKQMPATFWGFDRPNKNNNQINNKKKKKKKKKKNLKNEDEVNN